MSAAAARGPARSAGCARIWPPTRPAAPWPTGTSPGSARACTATTPPTPPSGERCIGLEAEVVLVGHDHDYERFALQTPQGRLDRARGIRQFVVGTGGKTHY